MPAGFIGDCDEPTLILRHIFDSILPVIADETREYFPIRNSAELKVFDLGTGAGLPAIPLAILFPDTQFFCIDSQEKRLRFVQESAHELGLNNITICHSAVEDFPKKFGSIKADVIIFRAFRKILASLELACFIDRIDSKVLYWRSQPILFSEVGLSRVKDLGYQVEKFVRFDSVESLVSRGVYEFTKKSACKPGFPRHYRKISRDPLVEKES